MVILRGVCLLLGLGEAVEVALLRFAGLKDKYHSFQTRFCADHSAIRFGPSGGMGVAVQGNYLTIGYVASDSIGRTLDLGVSGGTEKQETRESQAGAKETGHWLPSELIWKTQTGQSDRDE